MELFIRVRCSMVETFKCQGYLYLVFDQSWYVCVCVCVDLLGMWKPSMSCQYTRASFLGVCACSLTTHWYYHRDVWHPLHIQVVLRCCNDAHTSAMKPIKASITPYWQTTINIPVTYLTFPHPILCDLTNPMKGCFPCGCVPRLNQNNKLRGILWQPYPQTNRTLLLGSTENKNNVYDVLYKPAIDRAYINIKAYQWPCTKQYLLQDCFDINSNHWRYLTSSDIREFRLAFDSEVTLSLTT